MGTKNGQSRTPEASYGVVCVNSPGTGPAGYSCTFCNRGLRMKPYKCECTPDFVLYCWRHASRSCGCQEALRAAWHERKFYEKGVQSTK